MYTIVTAKKFSKKKAETSGIYAVVTRKGVCKYVGQTRCFLKRWRDHKHLLKANRHYNKRLQYTWNKYGEQNLKFIILEICELGMLNEREDYWIDQLIPECNVMKSASDLEYKYFPDEKKDYKKQGERFYRPKWHLWVYGGHKKDDVEKRKPNRKG